MNKYMEKIHTLAVAESPLTLYPPKLLTTQVNMASLPWGTVIFSKGYRKSGSNPNTASENKNLKLFAVFISVCLLYYTFQQN